MVYSRRTLGLLSAGIMIAMAPAAMAQGEPQTLDQQMEMQQQPSRLPPSVPPGAIREWPGTPSLATGPEQSTDDDGNAIDSEGGDAIPALPLEAQTMNGVTFITGGIGDEEVNQIKASEHQYNLHLLMTSVHGAFISDVNVNILDATGNTIASAQEAGPYFYARLPEGKYTVELTENGETKKFSTRITPSHSNVQKVVQFSEPGGIITEHQPTETVE